MSDKVIKVEIGDEGVFVDGELLEENDSVCEFTYSNKQIPKIQTGNEVNYVLLISSIVISLAVIIISTVVIKRKKQENN